MEPRSQATDDTGYTVVARRYRPKTFEELVGQSHVAQALEKAIATGRVGHAYLFTGARGVGKTSTARIFAKALNVPQASSDAGTKQQESSQLQKATEIAHAIEAGEDIDVIEIDAASNRGIDEIRQLRANVHVRPSRSTYKIYIIDEVHMLTGPAFNALLKTLEEPPPHVKFILCTTDPEKIPITVLSRCQRYDFAPVRLEAIQARLREITQSEGYSADDDALALLARRAAGSMRDSQSLLEQIMSFATDRITVEQVHSLLGTADEGRLSGIVETLIAKDPLGALQLVEESIRGGADAGQLTEQLLGYLRDLLATGIGGGTEMLKVASPTSHSQLQALAEEWSTASLLAAIQIIDEALVRMRHSVSAVTLLEVALVQICQLENLCSIPQLLEQLAGFPKEESTLSAAASSGSRQKKNASSLSSSPSKSPDFADSAGDRDTQTPASAEPVRAAASSSMEGGLSKAIGQEPLREEEVKIDPAGSSDALTWWLRAVATVDGLLADYASLAVIVEPQESHRWRIVFSAGAVQPKEYCEQPDRRAALQQALEKQMGRDIALQFTVRDGEPEKPAKAMSASSLRANKLRELSNDPYVKRLCEVLDGEIVRVDTP